jgi:hypothetical protein
MKIIQNDFAKELSELLTKHKKTFTADKSGIHVINTDEDVTIFLQTAETASEDSRDTLLFLIGNV